MDETDSTTRIKGMLSMKLIGDNLQCHMPFPAESFSRIIADLRSAAVWRQRDRAIAHIRHPICSISPAFAAGTLGTVMMSIAALERQAQQQSAPAGRPHQRSFLGNSRKCWASCSDVARTHRVAAIAMITQHGPPCGTRALCASVGFAPAMYIARNAV